MALMARGSSLRLGDLASTPTRSSRAQLTALLHKDFGLHWTGRRSVGLWIFLVLFAATVVFLYTPLVGLAPTPYTAAAGPMGAAPLCVVFLSLFALLPLHLIGLVEEREDGLLGMMQVTL